MIPVLPWGVHKTILSVSQKRKPPFLKTDSLVDNLFLDKTNFEKNFISIKNIFIFLKKCLFLKVVFQKYFTKIFTNFLGEEKFFVLKNIFPKKFPGKRFFSKLKVTSYFWETSKNNRAVS